MDEIRFDALTRSDLDAAVRLSTQAGWNQTPADWRRLIDHSSQGCFAGRIGGRLVATSTLVSHGRDAHWIGMVLVDEACRGRGYGTAILERAIRHGVEQGAEAIGLDATELGRPVYLKQGLVDVAPIDRWGGVLRPAAPPEGVELLDRCVLDQVALLDHESCAADRSRLLFLLATDPDATGWIARLDGRIAGYAFLRPGREHWHLGPVVAEETAVYEALLAEAARRIPGAGVLVDALRDPGVTQVLSDGGLEVRRRLTRMTYRRPQELLMGERVGAAMAFEWG